MKSLASIFIVTSLGFLIVGLFMVFVESEGPNDEMAFSRLLMGMGEYGRREDYKCTFERDWLGRHKGHTCEITKEGMDRQIRARMEEDEIIEKIRKGGLAAIGGAVSGRQSLMQRVLPALDEFKDKSAKEAP